MVDATQGIFKVTPRQLVPLIIDCFEAGLVPFVRSSPGVGKSSLMRMIAKMLSLYVIDHRLSTSEPTDMSGLPGFTDGFAKFHPFLELFPIEGTPIPKGFDGWLIFLDEYNSALKPVQAASYKLILDRMTGQHKLHERVVIALAGNLDTDRAITNMISTAMQSRVIHFELEVKFEDFLLDVALKDNWDKRIIAYLNQYPTKLMDFRPDHNEKTFCCPRTWEFLNKLIIGKEVEDQKLPLYCGTITSGVAANFVQFTRVYQHLINVKEILADPLRCRLPDSVDLRWATITHMMEHIANDNFADLAAYANRFTLDFRVLFFRSALVQHPQLRRHPALINAQVELARYLAG